MQKKYQKLVDNIENYFSKSDVVLQDARNTIKEVIFNNETLIVKLFKKPNIISNIIYSFFKDSKAKRAYNFGIKIAQFTPKVITYIEYYNKFGFLTKSYLIARKFDFDFDIRIILLDINYIDREKIFEDFAQFIYQLHNNNIFHKDLSPGNILIKKINTDYNFKIIDINRMTIKKISIQNKAKNFNKLWANDKDLALILRKYANIAKFDINYFVNLGLAYNQKNKQRKTRKWKIKKLFGL